METFERECMQGNYCDTIFFYVSLRKKEDYAGVSSKYATRMEYICKIYAKLLNHNMIVSIELLIIQNLNVF